MIEIELKFKIEKPFEVVRKLKRLGFLCSYYEDQRHQETIMYDNADKIMEKKDSRLRVRKREKLNIQVSYKKPITREGIKKEIEHEITIYAGEEESFMKILEEMGFAPVSSYEKYRTTLTTTTPTTGNKVKAEIDEYPFATYLEIEGSEEEIKKVAKELGLDMKDNITKSCDDLFAEWRKERGLKPKANMRFSDYGT